MIIAGERRYQACKLLNMTEVRCEVIESTEQTKLLIMAIENLQRKDLTIVEEGEIYERVKSGYGVATSHRNIAKILGIPRQRVDFAINSYTKLTPQVQQMVQAKEITEESTRALTKLHSEPEIQLRIAQELAQNISEVGLLQPITVRHVGELYRLIMGHRRYLACKQLGWQEIPAIIMDITEDNDEWFMLSENLQRDDLSEVEKAEKLHEMMELSGHHLSTYKIADKLGVSQKYVYDLLKIHGYPTEIKEEIKSGNIGADTIRSINKLETPEEQTKVVSHAITNELNRKQVDNTIEIVKELPQSILRMVGLQIKEII